MEKAMVIKVHRKGKVFIEQGKALVWKAGEPFKISMEIKRRLEFLKHNDPVGFREQAEKIVVEMVKYLVAENGGEPVELSKVQQDGSFKIGVSPETIKRYLFTHTASEAELKLVGKRVTVNPFFEDEEDETPPPPSTARVRSAQDGADERIASKGETDE